VSKMNSKPMVCLAETVHLSCSNTNTISEWTKMGFHMSHKAQVEAHFLAFGESTNLDARKVHCLHRMGSEIVLDAPDETPR
jgi:hypothetical protein